MSKRAHDKRDGNEPEITDALLEYRIPFWKLKPGDGADLFVTIPYANESEFVEVKMPGGRMTKRELELQAWCELNGVAYRIVRTANDIRDAYARHVVKNAMIFDRTNRLGEPYQQTRKEFVIHESLK